MKKIGCFIVIVAMLLSLTACGDPLVGCWKTTIDGVEGQMTLYKDGTGEIVSGDISRPCTWEVKDGTLTVIQDISGANFVFLDCVSYEISKDTMTITSYDGSKTLVFEKD